MFSRQRLEVLLLRRESRVPIRSGADERLKQRARGGVAVVRALRMPLHTEHEVIVVGAFRRFFDLIGWAPGNETETVAQHFRCLMMAGIDNNLRCRFARECSGGTENACQL